MIKRKSIEEMVYTIRVARSAITGRFVSLVYSKRHPKTTIIETQTRRYKGGKSDLRC